jgi:hypothetical protein
MGSIPRTSHLYPSRRGPSSSFRPVTAAADGIAERAPRQLTIYLRQSRLALQF